MRNPDSTKNRSTPTKPPWRAPMWTSTTSTIATARMPSSAGDRFSRRGLGIWS